MSSYDKDNFRETFGKVAGCIGAIVLVGIVYSCSTSSDRELSTDVRNDTNIIILMKKQENIRMLGQEKHY